MKIWELFWRTAAVASGIFCGMAVALLFFGAASALMEPLIAWLKLRRGETEPERLERFFDAVMRDRIMLRRRPNARCQEDRRLQ